MNGSLDLTLAVLCSASDSFSQFLALYKLLYKNNVETSLMASWSLFSLRQQVRGKMADNPDSSEDNNTRLKASFPRQPV